jgi:hypothetical protein
VQHATNQRAFRDCDSKEPFFRLYTLLVATEIAMKNRLPTFEHGHDLASLIPKAVTGMSAGLQAQLTSLDAALRALICTHRGARSGLNPTQYPGLRYLRHEKDGFVGDSSEAAIAQALRDAEQLVEELRRVGVTL